MKKGQLEIHETTLVMFIFVLIVVLGLVLFFNVSLSSIEDSDMEYREDKFKQLINIVPNMPELKLSVIGIEHEACIDLIKATAFRDFQGEFENLGYKKIEIIGSSSLVIYDNPRSSDSIRKYTSPICIYDYFLDIFEMAKLEVSWYV